MVRITVSGVDRIQERLRELMLYNNDRYLEIARRLCQEVGEPIIRAVHGNHAVIMTQPIENGYSITASGEDVLFIEFGTGDRAGAEGALYDAVPPIVFPGSWSATHSQQYIQNGYWFFGGQMFQYTEPHPAFYQAYQAMVEALPRISQEVFAER